LAPDEEGRRGDLRPVLERPAGWWQLLVAVKKAAHRRGQQSRIAPVTEGGAVVVERPPQRPRMHGRIAGALDGPVADGLASHGGGAQRAPDGTGVAEPEQELGQPGNLEEEEVPAARKLAKIATQVLHHDRRVRAVEDGEPTREGWTVHREVPRDA